MGEYQEDSDFNDLLDSDSGDDAQSEDERVNLLDIEDMTITGTSSSSKLKMFEGISLLDEMLPPEIDMDDDPESDDEEKNARILQQKQEAAENRKKLQKMLHTVAPGIDLFRTNSSGENGFKFFNMETLDLEKDFDYARRGKLLGHGFSNQRITEMLTDRLEFVRHLMPEAQSVLLCDQTDFRAIMNFLFYSISVCTDSKLGELMTKAFFDLRKNYGFKWNLTLKHVFCCLLNYGADEAAIFSSRFYQKFLEKHIEAVRSSGQKVSKKYELPDLPFFIKKRKTGGDAADSPEELEQFTVMTAGNFKFCVEKFLILLTDFSAGQPGHLEFRYRDNWSDQIIFLYVLLIVASDKRVIRNYKVREAIMTGLHYHLDSFSSVQWYWGPDKENQPKTVDGFKDFNHTNVCKSLIILLNEFFPGENCSDTINWEVVEDHSHKVTFRKNNTSDHHLNMLHRLSLVPPSYRGNQLRKYLAFMYLQTIAETVYVSPTHVDVFDIIEIPELCDELSPGLRLIVKAKNYDVIMTVVELYDIIIGHEPATDFTADKIEAIQRIQKNVLQWIQKKLPNMNRINIDDQRSIKGMQLSEYLDIVCGRWQTHCQRRG